MNRSIVSCSRTRCCSIPRTSLPGKTTLLRNFLNHTKLRDKLDSGDNIRTQQLLSSQDFSQILAYVEGYELLAIDEAQGIPSIGMALKIDPWTRRRVSGAGNRSAPFELAGQVSRSPGANTP